LIPVALSILSCHPAPAEKPVASSGGAHTPTTPSAASAATDTALYARLGGEAGFQAITAALAARIATDGRVGPLFADTDMEAFKANFATYLGQLCGGPARYRGPDMKTVHTGLAITDAQFDAMIEDLGAALEARGAAPADRAALMARMLALRGDIVLK
jgi:hemoglobin